MIRNIVAIDREKCTGCGLCAEACQEGAIRMIDGKAQLVRDDYCDGLGHCLPACPTDAIRIIRREAEAFDEQAVRQNQQTCAGAASSALSPAPNVPQIVEGDRSSQLRQWPVQIQLAPLRARYFQGAHLLVAADCAAYAHGDFHRRFMKNRITLIGCPKLDHADYEEKLTQILKLNDIQSLSIVRMDVPCCGGIERAAVSALKNSAKFIPWQIYTLNTRGEVLEP